MRKLFSLFVALLATTSLLAQTFQSGDLYYNITSSSAPYAVEVSSAVSSITSAIIPSTVTYNGTTYSVTSIGNYAFYGCSSIDTVYIKATQPPLLGGNSFYNVSPFICYIPLGTLEDYKASDWAKYVSQFVEIEYPVDPTWQITYTSSDGNIITPYRTYVFGANLISNKYSDGQGILTFDGPVTSIGEDAFWGCSSLKSITIPNSVTSIGEKAFQSCSSLTSVTIGNSVKSIGNKAFDMCFSLTSMVVESSNTTYDSRDNCNAIIETATNTLIAGCKNTTIPNSVTSIGQRAFCDYVTLTSITIPNSVWSIGERAFYNCINLTSITCEAATPPIVGSDAFQNVSISIPVYVPCGCINAYKAATGWKNFTNIQGPLAEYSIEVNVNDTIMGTAKVDYNNDCTGNQISATANYGCHFVQWSDGNTDNPRSLELTQDTILTAEFAQSFSGQCGDNLYWVYDQANKTISITGSGDMYNYTAETQPWLLFKEELTEIHISNKATSIGTAAFQGCTRLGKTSIGAAMQNIAASAFANCNKLYDIYCYAAEPPTGYTSSFANYNAFLHVPCESQRLYMLDILFGEFKYIECISSDEVTTDDIVITPGTTDVTITWPTEDNAYQYVIEIKKDSEVVCTLTFNAEGQLLNIAFAPGRDGNRPAQYAEQAGNGYRFTVTGLTEATRYAYSVTTKDAANKTIATYSGEFTTMGGTTTDMDNIPSPISNSQKLLRNGQLYIYHNGSTYNAMGMEL